MRDEILALLKSDRPQQKDSLFERLKQQRVDRNAVIPTRAEFNTELSYMWDCHMVQFVSKPTDQPISLDMATTEITLDWVDLA